MKNNSTFRICVYFCCFKTKQITESRSLKSSAKIGLNSLIDALLFLLDFFFFCLFLETPQIPSDRISLSCLKVRFQYFFEWSSTRPKNWQKVRGSRVREEDRIIGFSTQKVSRNECTVMMNDLLVGSRFRVFFSWRIH